jgi:NRPS condensation-like uncharacterized protein
VPFPAEIFDQVQLAYDVTGGNDHQLHAVLSFASPLDPETLRRAAVATLEIFPILATRYVDDERHPRWEEIEASRFDDAFGLAATPEEFERCVTHRIAEAVGPQVKVWLSGQDPCSVSVTLNHMVADGAGFKEYLYALAETYTALLRHTDFRPSPQMGDRSIRPVMRHFSLGARIGSVLFHSAENNRTGGPHLTFGSGEDVAPFMLTRDLGDGSVDALKAYSSARDATVNDMLLAACYRCLFRRLGLSEGDDLALPVMVDMRRYLAPEAAIDTLTNLSSTVMTALSCRLDESLEATLSRVKQMMDTIKRGDMGLNAFAKLDALFRLLPPATARRVLRGSVRAPLLSMTNLGVLDAERLMFGGVAPTAASATASAKYKPHFQVGVSSYRGRMTLSAGLYGGIEDRAIVEGFLAEMAEELA